MLLADIDRAELMDNKSRLTWYNKSHQHLSQSCAFTCASMISGKEQDRIRAQLNRKNVYSETLLRVLTRITDTEVEDTFERWIGDIKAVISIVQ